MTLILRRVAARVLAILRRVAARVPAYNAYWGASTKNRSKANRKSLRNRPQNGPKSVPNRSKIGPRSASEPTSLPTSILDRFGTVFGPFWARSWRPLGDFSGVKLGEVGQVGCVVGQVGPKIDFWRSWMAFKNEHDAGYLFEPIFGRFGSHLGVENGTKIGPGKPCCPMGGPMDSLGPLRGRFWIDFVTILGPLWGPFWKDFRTIFGRCRSDFWSISGRP